MQKVSRSKDVSTAEIPILKPRMEKQSLANEYIGKQSLANEYIGKQSLPLRGKRKVFFSKIKRRILKHVWLVRTGILGVVVLVIMILILAIIGGVKQTKFGFYFELARNFIFTPEEAVLSINNRTNILILGKGGKGHEAPDLTDTIIFASINHSNPSVDLISLPRDIWIPDLRTKLNSVYYWGNQRQEKGGIVLAKASVEEIVGVPVQYGIVVDFGGFKRVIDVLEGIEVDVERSFVDEKYPIPGREDDLCGGDKDFKCRYETLRFAQGKQIMDGDMALKFVRSRNAGGDEGTDFARAARQQKVIQAIKNKVLTREILLSPKKLIALKDAILESTETDLTPYAVAVLARRALSARNNISSNVLPEGFLEVPSYSTKYDNLYVFIPKNEGWEQVHEWVENILDKTN